MSLFVLVLALTAKPLAAKSNPYPKPYAAYIGSPPPPGTPVKTLITRAEMGISDEEYKAMLKPSPPISYERAMETLMSGFEDGHFPKPFKSGIEEFVMPSNEQLGEERGVEGELVGNRVVVKGERVLQPQPKVQYIIQELPEERKAAELSSYPRPGLPKAIVEPQEAVVHPPQYAILAYKVVLIVVSVSSIIYFLLAGLLGETLLEVLKEQVFLSVSASLSVFYIVLIVGINLLDAVHSLDVALTIVLALLAGVGVLLVGRLRDTSAISREVVMSFVAAAFINLVYQGVCWLMRNPLGPIGLLTIQLRRVVPAATIQSLLRTFVSIFFVVAAASYAVHALMPRLFPLIALEPIAFFALPSIVFNASWREAVFFAAFAGLWKGLTFLTVLFKAPTVQPAEPAPRREAEPNKMSSFSRVGVLAKELEVELGKITADIEQLKREQIAQLEKERETLESEYREKHDALVRERAALEAEKKMMYARHPEPLQHDVLQFNVGGRQMAAKRATLCVVPGSYLANCFSGRWEHCIERDADGCYFLDFDPECFEVILNWLRDRRVQGSGIGAKPPVPSVGKESHFANLVEFLGLKESADNHQHTSTAISCTSAQDITTRENSSEGVSAPALASSAMRAASNLPQWRVVPGVWVWDEKHGGAGCGLPDTRARGCSQTIRTEEPVADIGGIVCCWEVEVRTVSDWSYVGCVTEEWGGSMAACKPLGRTHHSWAIASNGSVLSCGVERPPKSPNTTAYTTGARLCFVCRLNEPNKPVTVIVDGRRHEALFHLGPNADAVFPAVSNGRSPGRYVLRDGLVPLMRSAEGGTL
ncbi:unnamed protein product [Vitrella brassicaformis CCMP3155]|uniref:Potassium channel tetramerisation-type BTB domain-containing protein n=1 Tax=Vitrella brassicaformis (strain CCMP3155) TaxID=1169540 RepID=A0A0G4ES00_VITBC|nr:unnamed protein product [Vitrella brassicaformis CCMP3155]|eukprot:CEM01001.1 unnamed protein product [Vitrella brassicaformis CCMP3155]